VVVATGMSITRRIITALLIFVSLGGTGSSAIGAEVVTDEATRIRVLRLMFPNARVSVSPTRTWNASVKVKALEPLQLNDALKSERVYDVVGAVTDHVERDAATDVTDPETPSNKRAVRLLLYRWRPEKDDTPSLIGILHYAFHNRQPALCCQAIGKVLLLSDDGNRLLECVARMPPDFTIFTSIRFLDLKGDGSEALLISADFSGPGNVGVDTVSLTVSHQKLRALFWTTTALQSAIGGGMFTMALDENRTRLDKGRKYWFARKTYIDEKGIAHTPPVTSSVSYPVSDDGPVDWPW
jgi:hypothetical protein